ncbi:GGDEF domain-containing protein [Ectothiorhodospira haloalkaliphila]|uniref:GGDEF domain-containing protein n=1 Tax=Ectothiorhodospira haloalkaliphila TaxID=421628 RepID=UPI001EE94D2E|nr:GGDEF domain-containing protein [Ectothiorhodospira haloalkaliphila]MCG5526143.1 GGDEF domain-containing protein [Ectothiorhodospira haloalkaliphila]
MAQATTTASAFQVVTDVIQALERHGLAPTPVNYWIFYEYFTRSGSKALVEAIDRRIESRRCLDEVFLQDLYQRFVAGETLDRLMAVNGALETLLKSVDGDLGRADAGICEFKHTLDGSVASLRIAHYPDDVRKISGTLLEAINQIQAYHHTLHDRLEEAEHETRGLRAQLDQQHKAAVTDPLTGILNRRGLEMEIERGVRGERTRPGSMLVMDIDHFKRINDTHGHAIGDVVIRMVARKIAEVLPRDTILARFGGEEYIALLPSNVATTVHQLKELGERIRDTIQRLTLVRQTDDLRVTDFTLSVGISEWSGGQTFDEVFNRADAALYQAKTAGRNRVVIASDPSRAHC